MRKMNKEDRKMMKWNWLLMLFLSGMVVGAVLERLILLSRLDIPLSLEIIFSSIVLLIMGLVLHHYTIQGLLKEDVKEASS